MVPQGRYLQKFKLHWRFGSLLAEAAQRAVNSILQEILVHQPLSLSSPAEQTPSPFTHHRRATVQTEDDQVQGLPLGAIGDTIRCCHCELLACRLCLLGSSRLDIVLSFVRRFPKFVVGLQNPSSRRGGPPFINKFCGGDPDRGPVRIPPQYMEIS